jgi:hypothetical protein
MLLSACQSGVSPTAEATSSATPNITNDPVENNLSNPEFTLEVIEEDTPVIAPLPSNTPYAVGIKTAFPVPTMTILQQQMLYQKLKDGTCILPCYLGIIPGKTSIDEAKTILEELGASLSPGTLIDLNLELQKYIYFLDYVDKDLYTQQLIYLFVHENKIIRIRVDLEHRSSNNFYEYWSNYSLKKVLEKLGFPDRTLINLGNYELNPGYSIKFVYEKQGVYIINGGSKQDGKICPNFKENYTSWIGLRLNDPNHYELLSSVGENLEIYPEHHKTIQEVFGMSDQQFYEKIILDPTICFDSVFKWP